jgi:hypothetical protein
MNNRQRNFPYSSGGRNPNSTAPTASGNTSGASNGLRPSISNPNSLPRLESRGISASRFPSGDPSYTPPPPANQIPPEGLNYEYTSRIPPSPPNYGNRSPPPPSPYYGTQTSSNLEEEEPHERSPVAPHVRSAPSSSDGRVQSASYRHNKTPRSKSPKRGTRRTKSSGERKTDQESLELELKTRLLTVVVVATVVVLLADLQMFHLPMT